MCSYSSFVSTIDLCLSVNTQSREDKNAMPYLPGQISSEIAMSINMHVQSFSVLHCICWSVHLQLNYNFLCVFHTCFVVSSNAEKTQATPGTCMIKDYLISRGIHLPQLTASNVFQTKRLRKVSIIWGGQFHKPYRVWLLIISYS